MKTDLIKLIALVWMCVMGYFMFEVWKDLNYMTDLVHAYIKLVMEYSRH